MTNPGVAPELRTRLLGQCTTAREAGGRTNGGNSVAVRASSSMGCMGPRPVASARAAQRTSRSPGCPGRHAQHARAVSRPAAPALESRSAAPTRARPRDRDGSGRRPWPSKRARSGIADRDGAAHVAFSPRPHTELRDADAPPRLRDADALPRAGGDRRCPPRRAVPGRLLGAGPGRRPALPCLIDQTALREPAGGCTDVTGRHGAHPTSPVPPN